MEYAVNLVSKGRIILKPLVSEKILLPNVIEQGFNKMLSSNKDIFRIVVKPNK